MKMLRVACCVFGAGLVLCGCVAVPKTTITGTISGQPFTLSSPKNSTLTNLDVTASTNGSVSIHVGSLVTVMDPAVITTTAEGEAKLVQAGAAAAAAAIAAIPKP